MRDAEVLFDRDVAGQGGALVKHVLYFHSAVCPRCRLSGHWLKQLRSEFPEVEIEKVEYLTNGAQAKNAGVRRIPTLVAGDKKLSGFLLTKSNLRQWLAGL